MSKSSLVVLVMEMVDEGVIDPKACLRDALNWMERDELEEFLDANGYVTDDEEEEDEEEEA